ncbi:MAG: N-acetylmuramoyl-L-alanine amidase [Clostridia bacterium]|nr:N-acetylmuramoyl-L-alanine amidase [Clostridia bacterium]
MMTFPSAKRFALAYFLLSLIFTAAVLVLCLFGRLGFSYLEADTAAAETDQKSHRYCIVLDAGHGGEDGGAVGADGYLEKEANLRITEMLRDQLDLAGIPYRMTRSDDRMLYDPQSDYRGHKKMLDLRARLDAAESASHNILISLHQNAFPEQKYSGLQVYYGKQNPQSAALAEIIQEAVRTTLQPDNQRKIKAADSNIYLLHRCSRPAVLVECGFLSNPAECAKLRDPVYLGELSTVIFTAICDFLAQQADST